MKNMKLGKKAFKVYSTKKTIHEHEKELRNQAIELSKNHVDTKPIRYLLKK